ncbi:MAG: hypothetical protein P3A28_08395 [Gemmatimonadota bacterium]|nr:hypothetical protein [Gemmatimonadota bacterium]
MRSIIRGLTIAGLIVGSTGAATEATAQAGGGAGAPRRPVPPAAAERTTAERERALEQRERLLERREAMLERQLGRDVGPPGRARLGIRGGAAFERGGRPALGPQVGQGPLRRPGMRGAGMRSAGMRGPQMGPGPRAQFARDRMVRRRAIAGERIRNLTDEQRTALRKYSEEARTQRRSVSDKVRAGTLTREQARAEIQKWRETNKPPVDLRRPPEGEER